MYVPWPMKDKYNFLTFKNVYLMNYLRIISLRNSLQNKLKRRHWYFFPLNVCDHSKFLVNKENDNIA